MRFILLAIVASTSLHAQLRTPVAAIKYWIEPCTHPETTHCLTTDPQLAEWALADWQRSSAGALTVEKTTNRLKANIRLHWASPEGGLYGEAVPFVEDGIRGADVYILADPASSADPLLRETIVYLTCLHETGHALGLPHTDAFADIMYSFQYGGDIPAYFGRYRKQLKTREDIATTTGTSPQDRSRLLVALARY